MTVVTVPGGFAIATPADWLVFDLDVLQDESGVAEFLDAREAAAPDLAQHRQALLALLIRAGRKASEAGMVFAAALATARAEGNPVVASLSIATIDREGSRTLLADNPPRASTATPTAVNGDRPAALRLPAGLAARHEHVTNVPLFAGTELVCFTVQYLLEVPGAPDDLLAITFASPAMAYKEELSDLFANVAGTFEWTYEES